MDVIRTVLGDIDAQKLGWCECRDHLFIASNPTLGDDETPPIDDYDDVVTKLMEFKNAGGGAILDGQTLGRGRMGSALIKAAQQTDVPIIASTGFNMQALYAGSFIFSLEKIAMEKLFINELTFGMVGRNNEYLASFCAGIIKTAVDSGGILKNAISEKLFSAAAKAAARTGAPVLVYVDTGADVLDVITFFSDHGVAPDRLMLCHLSAACCDAAMHADILESGAYVSYDVETLGDGILQKMLSAGHLERVLLSSSSLTDNTPYDALLKSRERIAQQLGIDNDALDVIMRRNPGRALRIRK